MKYLFLVLFTVTGFAADKKGEILTKEFKLDFSTATSAAGTYALGTLQEGALIKGAGVKITTVLAGTTSVSATVGRASDTDGYMLVKEVDGSANATFFGNGSSIWNDSTDENVWYYVADGEEAINFNITAGVVPTSGVLSIFVDYYIPRY